MPPTSARRGKTRRLDLTDKSDGEDPELVATPSRKRRKVQQDSKNGDPAVSAPGNQPASANRRRKERLSNISLEDDNDEDMTEDIVRQFRSAKGLQARVDHANEKHEIRYPSGKTAYAKLSGNGWTYYVTDIVVRLGRPPDEAPEPSSANTTHAEHREDTSLVHVDLGPSKLVSRQHAEIKYQSDIWTIAVLGRNGVRVDDINLARGETRALACGSVIEIAGTQMMWVTPNILPTVHQTVLDGLSGVQDEEDTNGGRFRAPQPPMSQRTPGAGPSSTGRPSSSRDAYGQQSSSRGNGYNLHRSYADNYQHDGATDVLNSATKSPGFTRALIIEPSEEIDYSQDDAKDIKPPHSYAQLIGMAILSNDEEKLTLAKIYDFIKERYAFYRFSPGGWQNSIRHNLSLNKCFEKVARRSDEPGKGMKWRIVEEQRPDFMKKSFINTRGKTVWNTSSSPSSPIKDVPSSAGLLDDKTLDNPFSSNSRSARSLKLGKTFIKTSSPSTSPVGAYPNQSGQETPDQNGSFFRGLPGGLGSSPMPMRGAGSPLPDMGRGRHLFPGLNESAAARTPGGPAFHGGRDGNDHFATPLFARQKPNLAPPSTAHVPSHYMPISSPAPFWKYANEYMSSPVKSSPVKAGGAAKVNGAVGKVDQEEDKHEDAILHSSSPPVSPTRPSTGRGRDESNGGPLPATAASAAANGNDEEDDDDEPALDMAKGFVPIGTFHRNAAIRGN